MSETAPVPIETQQDVLAPIDRAQVFAFEQAINNGEIGEKLTELPLRHHFAHRVYAREISIPAGVVLIGRLHKHPQINILSKGDVSVLVDGAFVRVQAPFTVVSPAGAKRIIAAHTDAIWTTILGTDETDPDVIEDTYTVASEAEYQAHLDEQQAKRIE